MIKNKKSNKNVIPLGGQLNKTSQSFTLFNICNCLEEEEQKENIFFFMNFVAKSTVALPEGLEFGSQRPEEATHHCLLFSSSRDPSSYTGMCVCTHRCRCMQTHTYKLNLYLKELCTYPLAQAFLQHSLHPSFNNWFT